MGLIWLRPRFFSDFGINGAPAKQMRHLPSAQEDWDEGGLGGVDVTRQTDVPLYYPASSSSLPCVLETKRKIHDFRVGVFTVYHRNVLIDLQLVVGVCARARARVCARAGRGNANNGPENCKALNLELAVNSYATLHCSEKKSHTRVCTLTLVHKHARTHLQTSTHTQR